MFAWPALGHENVVPLVAVPSCSLGLRLVTKMWSRLFPCQNVRLACAWSRKCGPVCCRAIMFAWRELAHENVVPFVAGPSCSLGVSLLTKMRYRLLPCHHVRLACAWSRKCGSACSRAIMFAWPALGHENVVPLVVGPSCSLGCAWSRKCGRAKYRLSEISVGT